MYNIAWEKKPPGMKSLNAEQCGSYIRCKTAPRVDRGSLSATEHTRPRPPKCGEHLHKRIMKEREEYKGHKYPSL